ncbi:hypothetical protein BJ165DRAFT_1513150 [Panaeolus papilionaceus]|nr:hypothetical protein BJ165DRAFT_1513150 [Panaeolus papilionaceus]
MTTNGQVDGAERQRFEEHDGIYQPTFWWFTETAFPLIAGTFGPVANLFSVCSLAWTWRVQVSNSGRVPDPAWLIVLNSCSLGVSCAANVALLLNFARRIPYYTAQIITITLWYIASILLLIPIALTHLPSIHPSPSAPVPATITHHPFVTAVTALSEPNSVIITEMIPKDEMAYSQAYYYALISCIFYAIISTLLLWNFLGTYQFHAYPPSFATLTSSQRTLMLQTMAFIIYLGIGGAIFSSIQDWGFQNALYWADYTLLTIGLGSDFPVTTAKGRIVAVPYITFGICFLGLVVGSVRGLVVERAKYKFSRRYLGKARKRLGSELRRDQEAALSGRLLHVDLVSESRTWHRSPIKGVITFLYETALGPRNIPLKIRKDVLQPWHHSEFEVMRLIESAAEQRQRFISLSVAFLAFLVVWLVGAIMFWVCEKKSQDWTYPTSLYFTYTSLLTVGYGDYYPTSPSGKPFFVAWSLIAVPTMTVFIGAMGDTVGIMIRDASTWLGQWTILPERHIQPISTSRNPFRREHIITRRKYTFHHNPSKLEPSRYDVNSPTSNYAVSSASVHPHQDNATSPTSNGTQGQSAAVIPKHEQRQYSDTHQNLAIALSRAVGDLSNDLGDSPPRRYSWKEWVYFLELLHKWPSTAKTQGPAVSGGQIDLRTCVLIAPLEQVVTKSGSHSQHSRPSMDHDAAINAQAFEGRRQRIADEDEWTWLSDNGPLFSKLTETEWLIERVCWRLEAVLDANYAES